MSLDSVLASIDYYEKFSWQLYPGYTPMMANDETITFFEGLITGLYSDSSMMRVLLDSYTNSGQTIRLAYLQEEIPGITIPRPHPEPYIGMNVSEATKLVYINTTGELVREDTRLVLGSGPIDVGVAI